MGTIVPFIRDKAFAPETIELMSEAFVKAKAFLRDGDATIETLAMRIITMASTGERDPDKLAAAALAGFCAGGSTEHVEKLSRA
jgi:hypothetical protein